MRDNMKKRFLIIIVMAFMSVSCVTTVGHRGSYVAIAPPLPVTVESVDPYSYYTYGGFYYYYHGDRWYYSRSKSGRWIDLPRNHYPKGLKFKSKRNVRVQEENRSRINVRDQKDKRNKTQEIQRRNNRGRINETEQKGL